MSKPFPKIPRFDHKILALLPQTITMQIPLISIIIPTFNSSHTIAACLSSIINQTYKNIEIIVIDGRSSDKTIEITKSFEPHIRCLISEPDSGIYEAMNKGIARSNGNFLYFIGSDDRFYNEHVLERIFQKSKNYTYDVIYGNVFFLNSKTIYDGKFSSLKLLNQNICHQSIFTSRNVFDKIGLFDTSYTIVADWVFNIKWHNHPKLKIKYTNEIIAVYNENGFSGKNTDLVHKQNRESLEKNHFSSWVRFLNRKKKKKKYQWLIRLFYPKDARSIINPRQ